MAGKEINIDTADGQFGGYLAPASGGSAPGIVVIQEIFGVNAVMRGICDRLASAGFTALCPDLFWRIEPDIQLSDQVPNELQRAFDLFGQFNVDAGMKDIQASISYLRNQQSCNGTVGTTGYCLGGLLAYLSATRTDTEASVGYYGVGIQNHLAEASNIKKPLMLHIAEKDGFVPPEAQSAMKDGLSGNPLVTLHSYPNCDHAFARAGGDNFLPDAAALADSRTIDFFRQHLT